MPLTGVSVLLASFLPWWSVYITVQDDAGERTTARHASAWASSSQWSAGLAVCLGAAVCWALVQRAAPRQRRAADIVLALTAAGGLGSVLDRWRRVAPAVFGERSTEVGIGPPAGDAEILPLVRDELYTYRAEGLSAGVGWGAYVGCVAMAALVVALLLPKPPTAPGDSRPPP